MTYDPTAAKFAADVDVMKAKVRRAIATNPEWACPHCGGPVRLGAPPWNPVMLREAAEIRGAEAMYALLEMEREGELATDKHFQYLPGARFSESEQADSTEQVA